MEIDKNGLIVHDPFELNEEYEYEKAENTLLYQLALEITHEPIDKEYIVDVLMILPAEYAWIALSYAELIDPNNKNEFEEIERLLGVQYTHRFKKLVESRKVKSLTSWNKKDIADYGAFKRRIFDMTERIMIIIELGYNPLEVAGKYKGEDSTKKAVSDVLNAYNRYFNERDNFTAKIIEPMLETVLSRLRHEKKL